MEGAARTLHPRRDIDVPDPAKMLLRLNVWCKIVVPVLVDFIQLAKTFEDTGDIAGGVMEIFDAEVLVRGVGAAVARRRRTGLYPRLGA